MKRFYLFSSLFCCSKHTLYQGMQGLESSLHWMQEIDTRPEVMPVIDPQVQGQDLLAQTQALNDPSSGIISSGDSKLKSSTQMSAKDYNDITHLIALYLKTEVLLIFN